MALERPGTPRWHSPEGHSIIQEVVKEHTPWKAGLRDTQLEVVAEVLDGTSFLYIDATGSGKTAAFSIPILVLLCYNRNLGKLTHTKYQTSRNQDNVQLRRLRDK